MIKILNYIYQVIFIKYLYSKSNINITECPNCYNNNIKYFNSYRYKYTKINISSCDNCNYIFQNPRLNDLDLNTFYKLVYRPFKSKKSYSKMFQREKRRGEYIYKYISSFIKKEKKINILEYGCGSGGIIDTLRNKFNCDVTGLDLDIKAVEFGCQNKLRLVADDLDSIKNNKYDLIIASHVLEHLTRPKEMLEKLIKLLSDNGLIYIEVPGMENPKVINSNYSIQPGHLNYFKLDVIMKICNEINLISLKSNNKIQILLQKKD